MKNFLTLMMISNWRLAINFIECFINQFDLSEKVRYGGMRFSSVTEEFASNVCWLGSTFMSVAQ